MAAMEKDLDRNPSLKRQYDITGNYQPPSVSSTLADDKPAEKKIKKVPTRKPPPPPEPKAPEPERPEQQSRIGSWQSIDKPVEYNTQPYKCLCVLSINELSSKNLK